jgi:hypothetical protein
VLAPVAHNVVRSVQQVEELEVVAGTEPDHTGRVAADIRKVVAGIRMMAVIQEVLEAVHGHRTALGAGLHSGTVHSHGHHHPDPAHWGRTPQKRARRQPERRRGGTGTAG